MAKRKRPIAKKKAPAKKKAVPVKKPRPKVSHKSIPLLKKMIIIPDVHCPYHDKKSVELVIKVIKKIRPKVIVCLGDFADFYQVSSHPKSTARKMSFFDEVLESKKLLKRFKDAYRGCERFVFCEGNHEDRLSRYVRDKCPELHKFGITADKLLEISSTGWEFVKYGKHSMVGNLVVTHDPASSGRNAHRKAKSISAGNSAAIGHTHRMSIETGRDIEGNYISSSMFGCLLDFEDIVYMKSLQLLDWVQGFGIGYIYKDGTTVTYPIPIIKNRAIVEGKVFTTD